MSRHPAETRRAPRSPIRRMPLCKRDAPSDRWALEGPNALSAIAYVLRPTPVARPLAGA